MRDRRNCVMMTVAALVILAALLIFFALHAPIPVLSLGREVSAGESARGGVFLACPGGA